MSEIKLELPRGKGKQRLDSLYKFAAKIVEIQNQIGFKISARGWCYQLEGFRFIDKSQFNRVQDLINECRKNGLLPVDIVAEEEARKFSGVEVPESDSPSKSLAGYIRSVMRCEEWYTPDWWDGEEYYIQMLVEKIDLKTLFSPVCKKYHIPIATSKGWSSMLQRAEYAKRFQEAKDKGLKCVLLYCGDHDPDGLRISESIRSNLYDLVNIRWISGVRGYNPRNLIIDRFGLNFDFIEKNELLWINNLITGSGKNLADPSHKNHFLPYMQKYLADVGERKCEANAIVIRPEEARQLCTRAIEKYLGEGVLGRFQERRDEIVSQFDNLRDETGVQESLEEALRTLEEEEE